MFEIGNINAQNKQEFYKQLNTYLIGLISEETDWLAGTPMHPLYCTISIAA